MELLILFSMLLSTVLGQVLYNAQSDICCNGITHPKARSAGVLTGCCGDKPTYTLLGSLSPQLCCKGVPHENPGGNLKCCGSEPYDHCTHACLNKTTPLEIPPADKEAGNTEVCGESEEQKEFYNPKNQLCCEGNVKTKESGNHSCCGKEPYNFMTSLCCKGEVLELPGKGKFACCGSSIYDMDTQMCCTDTVHPKMQNDHFYENTGIAGPKFQMASTTPRTDFAANNKMMVPSQCCGSEPWNRSAEACCHQASSENPFKFEFKKHTLDKFSRAHSRCCGLELMDIHGDSCVDGQPLPNTETKYHYCCQKKYKFIAKSNSWTEVANAKVEENEEWCEDPKSIIRLHKSNTEFEICRKNIVTSYSVGQSLCEVDDKLEAYNTTTHVCCHHQILEKITDEDGLEKATCCQPFDPNFNHNFFGKYF